MKLKLKENILAPTIIGYESCSCSMLAWWNIDRGGWGHDASKIKIRGNAER